MANKLTLQSSKYDDRYLKLVCTQTPNDSTENTSTINWTLSVEGGGDAYYSTGPTKVIINGNTVYSKERVGWSKGVFPAKKGSVSGSLVVSHNNNGTKKINVELSTAIYTSTVSKYSDTWELDSIPSHANFTKCNISNITENTVTVNWDADATCDAVAYSINDGDWEYPTMAKTFVVDGLTANTDYKIKVAIRREESQLWAYSKDFSFTTYDYPYCTDSPNFTIGDPVTLKFYNPLGREFTFNIIANGSRVAYDWVVSGESYKGIYSESAQEQLYNSIPNTQDGKYKVVVTYGDSVKTRDNGNTYAIDPSKCKPTFTDFSFDADWSDLLGDPNATVKDKGGLHVYITSDEKMTTINGAKPDYYVVSIDTISKSVNHSENDVSVYLGTVNSTGVKRLTVRAYDSRKLWAEVHKEITVYDYSAPVINVDVKRLNNYESQTTLKISGTYSRLNVGDVDKNNVSYVTFQYGETGDTLGISQSIPVNSAEGKFTCNDVVLSLDNSKSFNIWIQVYDEFGFADTEATVDVGNPLFFISTNKKECYINGKRVLHDSIIISEANTNLNNYLTTGLYFFGTEYTPVNIPAGVNGWLEVIASTDDRVKQIWYRCGTADTNDYMTYTRTYIAGTWGNWYRLATLTPDLNNERSHIADYVIEQGTSGMWTYEKWASGKAVCWGEQTIITAVNKVTNSYFYYAPEPAFAPQNYPFEFSEIPNEQTTLCTSSKCMGWLYTMVMNTTSMTGKYNILRWNVENTENEMKIRYYVIGKWK